MTKRILAPACIIATAILISCNHNKNFNKSQSAVAEKDTVEIRSAITEEPNLNASYISYEKEATQHYIASSKKVSVITAKKGLKVFVDPRKLETLEGVPANGNIKVNIIELTNTDELFKSNAATMSDGQLLMSGGSYYVSLECNGSKLKLKKGQTMQVQFPVLKKGSMELFYGERNEGGIMNWKSAGLPLKPESSKADQAPVSPISFIPQYNYFEVSETQKYSSLKNEVYYYKEKMTLGQMVDTLNARSKRVYLDSIYNWPVLTDASVKRRDTNFLLLNYGPMYMLQLRNYRSKEREDSIRANVQCQKEDYERSVINTLNKEAISYYSASDINSFGWLNCDMYYKFERKTEMEIEIPITYNNSVIQYFVMFKNFNGLISSFAAVNNQSYFSIVSLPANSPFKLIIFTKKEGVIYESNNEFVVQNKKRYRVDFSPKIKA
jgi:hypothetical protein